MTIIEKFKNSFLVQVVVIAVACCGAVYAVINIFLIEPKNGKIAEQEKTIIELKQTIEKLKQLPDSKSSTSEVQNSSPQGIVYSIYLNSMQFLPTTVFEQLFVN